MLTQWRPVGGGAGGGPSLPAEPTLLSFSTDRGRPGGAAGRDRAVCGPRFCPPAACRSRVTSRMPRTRIYHIYDIFYTQPLWRLYIYIYTHVHVYTVYPWASAPLPGAWGRERPCTRFWAEDGLFRQRWGGSRSSTERLWAWGRSWGDPRASDQLPPPCRKDLALPTLTPHKRRCVAPCPAAPSNGQGQADRLAGGAPGVQGQDTCAGGGAE